MKDNPKALDNTINDLKIITGQTPIVTKAKKAIAAFKIREGVNIGCKVTLRSGKCMILHTNYLMCHYQE